MAHSTLMAIMGRTAAYTGKEISWTDALNSQQQLVPDNLTWDMELPIRPLLCREKRSLSDYPVQLQEDKCRRPHSRTNGRFA